MGSMKTNNLIIDKSMKDDFIICAKGVSIITIVLYHLAAFYCDWVPPLIKRASIIGGNGIYIFFLLSGYGLNYSKIKNGLNHYWRKRFSRVYFPYIFIVFVSFLLPVFNSQSSKINALLSHLFFYKAFFEEFIRSYGRQFWYISTIFELYLVFYIYSKIVEKMALKTNWKKLIIVSTVCSIIWMAITGIFSDNSKVFYSTFLTFLWVFVFGNYLAEIKFKKEKHTFNKSYITLFLISTCFIGYGVFVIISLLGVPFIWFNDFFSATGYVSFVSLLYIYLNGHTRLLRFIGEISFEWFLVHILVFELFYTAFNDVLEHLIVKIVFSFIVLLISILVAVTYNRLTRKVHYELFTFKKQW